MKTKILVFMIVCVLCVGTYFLGYQTTKQQVNQKENEVKQLVKSINKEKAQNSELKKLSKRQSKTVISEEEKQIRETTTNFTNQFFSIKKGQSFKDVGKQTKHFLTDKYFNDLFSDGREKFSIYDNVTVSNIHVYFDVYDPKKDNYKVFVQFDERIDTELSKEVETRKTSVQLDLVRTNDKWLINNVQRFNLQKNGH